MICRGREKILKRSLDLARKRLLDFGKFSFGKGKIPETRLKGILKEPGRRKMADSVMG